MPRNDELGGGYLTREEQEKLRKAEEKFQAYRKTLSLELSPLCLSMLDELLRAREEMETIRSKMWYCQGMAADQKDREG